MIDYSVFMMKNPQKPNEAPKAYARNQIREIWDLNKFSKHIASHHSGYSRGIVKAILSDKAEKAGKGSGDLEAAKNKNDGRRGEIPRCSLLGYEMWPRLGHRDLPDTTPKECPCLDAHAIFGWIDNLPVNL